MVRLSALALVLPAVLAASRPDAARAAEAWVSAQSPHFLVVSNAGERSARRVAHQFEQIRGLFESTFRARLDPGRPFVILAVDDEASMKELVPWYWERRGGKVPAGLFVKGVEKHYALLRLDAGEGSQPFHVLYHEYVHLVTSLNYRRLPLWLNEGLAEYYGGADIDEQQLRWGMLQPWHVLVLRAQPLLPLQEMLAADYSSSYYNEGNRATIFYAQSAVLTHYLMIGSKERRGQLSTLIKALAADVPPDDAHQQALGDLKKLETELRRYVSGFSFPGFKRELQLDAQTIRTYRLSSGEAAAARGDFLLHLGRTREARALLEQAVAEAPGLSAAHESLGLVELRDGRHAEAEARLARALELAPDNYQARYHRDFVAAKAARTAEDTARREAELRRVISLNPQFSPAHVRLTRLLMEEKRWGEALPVARRACELDPAILWYQLLVKQALTHLGLAGEAAKVEGAILSAARSDPEVLASVVSHYQEDGRGQEAEALLRRARDANPRAISILSQLARFLGREKRAQEAEAVWREALKVQPDVPLLQNALAYALAEEGTKAAEALELVDKALKRQPKVGAYLDTRGWALFKLKRFAEAEEALRQALQADPGEAALHDHLGDVLLARGNRAAALEQWQRALAASDLDDELKAALETKVREAAALKPS